MAAISPVTPVFGLSGTGRWTDDERPTSWRQAYLKQYPQGKMPLTALQSKMGKEKVSSSTYHWFDEEFLANGGVITAVYTNPGLSTAYATTFASLNAPAGSILYLKVDMTADDSLINYVVPGSGLYLTNDTDERLQVRAEVLATHQNGANSWVRVKTLTADAGDTGGGSYKHSLTEANRALVMPATFAEFGGVPEVLGYKPFSLYNYTSIKKTAMALSGTAMSERGIRYGDPEYTKLKNDAFENFGIQCEHDLIFSVRGESQDPATHQLKRTSMGIMQYMDLACPAQNTWSFHTDTDYAGESWLNAGEDALVEALTNIATFADFGKTINVMGQGAVNALTRLAKANANITISDIKKAEYGLNIQTLVTSVGMFNFMTHPLFNYNPSLRNMWLGVPFDSMTYRYLEGRDIDYLPDPNYKKGGLQHVDGIYEMWMGEFGYEFSKSKSWYRLYIGKDSFLAAP